MKIRARKRLIIRGHMRVNKGQIFEAREVTMEEDKVRTFEIDLGFRTASLVDDNDFEVLDGVMGYIFGDDHVGLEDIMPDEDPPAPTYTTNPNYGRF